MTALRHTLALLLGLGLYAPALARAQVRIVATLPDFAAIARVVGGDHVRLSTLARGTEDAHFVDPRPSFIRTLNRADLLLHTGADLEIGWLPPLINNARNPHILPGRLGNLPLNEGIQLLDVADGTADRSQGDVHPQGNPHYWLDPLNGCHMANTLAERLAQLDPDHRDQFHHNAGKFVQSIQERLPQWQEALQPLRNAPVLTYHKTFDYLAQRFDLRIVGQLEPLPGIEPSPTHITQLIPQGKEQGVQLILIETFRPRRTPNLVAEALNARVVELPDKVNADEEATDYVKLFDRIVALLTRPQP